MRTIRCSLYGMVALSILMITACAGVQTAQPMTAKQQASIWLGIYNAQYDDAMFIMTNSASTEAQRAVAREKKRILAQAWPLLKIYVSSVDSGATPTASDTAQLIDLINQLTAMAGGV